MKKLIPILLILLLFSACNNPDCDDTLGICPVEIESTWLLREILMDPGDGSGTFSPIISNRTLTFFEDGTFNSVGSLCSLSADDNQETSGSINYSDGLLEFMNCYDNTSAEMISLPFSINGDELILSFPCDEPCQLKYQKGLLIQN